MFNNKLLRTQSGKILTYVQPCVVMPDGCGVDTNEHPRWNEANYYGTNNFGFNAFAGGARDNYGNFYNIGYNGYWWSATESSTDSVWQRYMRYNYSSVDRFFTRKELGLSVRCVKDYTGSQPNGTILSNDYTDGEGNTYDVVVIGNQLWTIENLKTTKYQNGTNIPNVTDNNDWRYLTTGAYCWYDNDYNTWGVHYGALYNWYAVDSGLVDNNGYRVPSDSDWTQLTDYLIGTNWCNGVVVNETNVGQFLKSCRQVNHPIVINCNTRVYDMSLQFYPDDPYEYYKINGVSYLNNYGTYFIDEENPIGQSLTEGYTFNYNYNAGDTIEFLRTQMGLIINGVGKLDSGNGSIPSPWIYTITESDVENGIYVNIFDYAV